MQSTSSPPKIVAIDDHAMILTGIVDLLKQKYPEAEVWVAQTKQAGQELIASQHPDLAIVDLAIPNQTGSKATAENGVTLLEGLMQQSPLLNIAVLSANANPLVRLKPQIDNHEGGFTVSDKGWAIEEIVKRVNMALEGGRFLPKEMKLGLELKSEWLEMLRLAFEEGLTDKAIAQRMSVAEKTVQNYFTKVQDVLEIYREDGHNLRSQTARKAREAGLID
ncbi:MAG: response regulator transcription factor [Leptolyngbyaceae cyanobacterium SM1_3_5]|nr:response regulator transcription factor [Leptolyngbyaceae cyanobacterium SM1_3_5]